MSEFIFSIKTIALTTSSFAAIGALAVAVGYGAYKFRSKGKMSTSVFLMQLRVGAQGIAVGALTLGLLYSMYNEHVLKKKN